MTAAISVEPPTRDTVDYHCSACRKGVPVAALITFGGRSFALCHVCGRALCDRLAALCPGLAVQLCGDGPS